jgi:uncharacterized RDD family membrane protein YckC
MPLYSGFWRRVAATLVDACLLLALLLAVSHAVGWPGLLLRDEFAPRVGAFIASLLYYAGFESSVWQATPGKRAVRIKVTDLAGHRIGVARAVWRHVAELLSVAFVLVGFLMAAFTRRRQCLHDLMAGTLVVRAARSPQDIAFAPPARAWPRWRIAALIGAWLAGLALLPRLTPWVQLPFEIPGIEDNRYHARTQILAGLYYASDAIDTVEGLYAESHDFTAVNVSSVDLDDEATETVANMAIVGGSIRITFGGQADSVLQGRTATLTPAVDEEGNISWVCGVADVPEGYSISREDYRRLTTVPRDALPADCLPDEGESGDEPASQSLQI